VSLSHSQHIYYNNAVGRLSSCLTGVWVENNYGVRIHHQGITMNSNHALYSYPSQALKPAFPSDMGIEPAITNMPISLENLSLFEVLPF